MLKVELKLDDRLIVADAKYSPVSIYNAIEDILYHYTKRESVA